MSPMGRGSGKTPENLVQLVSREVNRIGQNATARAIGIPLRSVQKYLAGISEPTQASLEKLAAYFDVSVEYLRGQIQETEILSSLYEQGFFENLIQATGKGGRESKEEFLQRLQNLGAANAVRLAETINTLKEQTAPPENSEDHAALVEVIAKDIVKLNIFNLRDIHHQVKSRLVHQEQKRAKQ